MQQVLTCAGSSHFSTHLFNPQQLTEKWLFLQSMDSHPEQIALRPKEFFCTYDIEVLTEMQVRRILFVPKGKCGYAKAVLGNVAAVSVLGSVDATLSVPLFLPQSAGCLWLFKTQLIQCSCGRKGTPGMTMVWPSVVTIICYHSSCGSGEPGAI